MVSSPLPNNPTDMTGSHITSAIDDADVTNPFRCLSETEMTAISDYIISLYPENQLIDETDPTIKTLDNNVILIDKVSLHEPRKDDIYAYKKEGIPVPRRAMVALYNYVLDKYTSQILTINNMDGTITFTSSTPTIHPYIKPSYSCFDENKGIQTVLANEEFQARIKYRLSVHFPEFDFSNPEDISKLSFDNSVNSSVESIKKGVPGNFISFLQPGMRSKRIMYLTCHWNDAVDGFKSNVSFYTQPFTNFIICVDTRTGSVIKFIQWGNTIDPNIPLPSGNIDWTRPMPTDPVAVDYIKPLQTTMPDGPSYTFNGRNVKWDNWEFTWSFDQVYGLMIYDVTFNDKTVWKTSPTNIPVKRTVLYKGHIPELITAYGDAEFSERNFWDISEYPARDFMIPFIKGLDCPEYTDLFDVTAVYTDGSLFTINDAVALYETDGGVLWRHTDYPCDAGTDVLVPRGRRSRKLIISSMHVISNYDYVFQWIFSQDGGIEVKISPSGVVECNTQLIDTIDGKTEKDLESLTSSTLVEKYISALNHSHVGVVRLDFEVDRDPVLGVTNTVVEKTLMVDPVSNKNLYGGKWRETETILEEECFRTQTANIVKWSIVNPNSLNFLGYPRSYEIEVDKTPLNVFNKLQTIVTRAEYLLNHSICFTKYNDDEQTPTGEFTGQEIQDNGLRKYILASETITESNIVAWAITGFAHSPRIEDYPVMSLETFGLKLKPENFFNENPGLYVRSV